MSSTTADHAAGLAARAAAVIPGGVNSGQRQVPGLEDLIIAGDERLDVHGRRAAAPTPTTTPPSGRRCSATTTPTSTRRSRPSAAPST